MTNQNDDILESKIGGQSVSTCTLCKLSFCLRCNTRAHIGKLCRQIVTETASKHLRYITETLANSRCPYPECNKVQS